MCRWFCMVSHEDMLLEDAFLRPRHSLVKQIDSHYLPSIHKEYQPSDEEGAPNLSTNMDGFGLCYWTIANRSFSLEDNYTKPAPSSSPSSPEDEDAGEDKTKTKKEDEAESEVLRMRPVVFKDTRPPMNVLNLKSLCAGTSSKGLLAHIRAGTGLTPVVETNNHPFPLGRYALAHNGTLSQFTQIKLSILQSISREARAAILGTTDSECMMGLFWDRLTKEQGKRRGLEQKEEWKAFVDGKKYDVSVLKETLRAVLAELESLVAESKASETSLGIPISPHDHSALNIVITDGSSLVAIRYASPPPREPPSLYYSTKAGATLNRKFEGHPEEGHPEVDKDVQGEGEELQKGEKRKEEHGRHVIVASEPSTYDQDEWTLIEANHMISVDTDMEPVLEAI